MKIQLFIFAAVFVASSLQNRISPLWKNNLLTTVPNWGKEYQVSFEVKPVSVVHPWGSIVHFTTGKDCCAEGNRIPGVWFQPTTLKLMVSTGVNGGGNTHWNAKNALPTNKFTKVVIKQVRAGNTYTYSVDVDGKRTVTIVNKSPKVYKNVKVYAGSPYYMAADAVVRNLQFTVEPEFMGNIKRGRKLKTIPNWGKEWRMTFRIKPLSAQKPWSSILHMTTGKDASRIPGIWLYPNSMRLTVFTQLGTNNNWAYTTPKNLPVTKYTTVHIEQIMHKNNKYYYKILIDGKQVVNQHQTKPTNYKNVILYAANPWYAPADVYVRDLHLEGVSGQHYYPTL